MRIVFVSDTHSKLSRIAVPDGDMLVHCGDFMMRAPSEHRNGRPRIISSSEAMRRSGLAQVERFNAELGALPHRYKIVVAGNHDYSLENDSEEARSLLTNAIYLQDELVEIEGLSIWGSPWQPEYRKWAFNLPRHSPELAAVWRKMPDRLDILVTHGPPAGILDRTPSCQSVGDELLLKRVLSVRPRLHAFGHVHHSYGVLEKDGITFVNAAALDESYKATNPAVVFDIAPESAAEEQPRRREWP